MNPSKTQSFVELTLASTFWGFGFIASIWCMQSLSPPALILYRFLMAFLAGALILLFRRTSLKDLWHECKLSLLPAFLISLTLWFQTYGLRGTTATKSAFITTTYVIIVPIMAHLLGHEKVQLRHWLWVLIAIAGTYMIVDLRNNDWTLADLLTCVNAVAASGHILCVGKLAPRSRSPFAFNVFQAMWVAVLSSPFLLFTSGWNLFAMSTEGWIGLVSLGLGSSLLAFFLQVRAQRSLSPSIASILFLLESPFSFLFAAYFLHETLNTWQMTGAALILISCLASIFSDKKRAL